jgi:hypothetical protein
VIRLFLQWLRFRAQNVSTWADRTIGVREYRRIAKGVASMSSNQAPAGWPVSAAAQGEASMSTTGTPVPSESVFEKIWSWVKKETTIVEADLAKILGSTAAADLETIGKTLLSGELGPLATAAIADATDVVTGQMSVSKAISSLVTLAEANGKTLSQAAALQVIALAQNALPVSAGATVTPVA